MKLKIETILKIIDLYCAGNSNSKIAKMLNISQPTVSRYTLGIDKSNKKQVGEKGWNSDKIGCMTCKYSGIVTGSSISKDEDGCVTCEYILIKGERRNCPAADCDKYVMKADEKKKHNPEKVDPALLERVSKNIKELRQSRGKSQHWCCTHISQSWSKWEKGLFLPSNRTIPRICKVFGVKSEDIFK